MKSFAFFLGTLSSVDELIEVYVVSSYYHCHVSSFVVNTFLSLFSCCFFRLLSLIALSSPTCLLIFLLLLISFFLLSSSSESLLSLTLSLLLSELELLLDSPFSADHGRHNGCGGLGAFFKCSEVFNQNTRQLVKNDGRSRVSGIVSRLIPSQAGAIGLHRIQCPFQPTLSSQTLPVLGSSLMKFSNLRLYHPHSI